MKKILRILGTRGVPAAHGGFETFAEHLALYLVDRGWRVIVYCQEEGTGPIVHDVWKGIERIRIQVPQQGALGTIIFDWHSISHAKKFRDLNLTLGYNTAIFCYRLRIKRIPNLINMDGIEWSRGKWGLLAKAWFWCNDWAGCLLGNHLIADHPSINKHLQSRVRKEKITTIPYGADLVKTAHLEPVFALGLQPGRYITLIARAEPENSVLQIVRGFSQKCRGYKLVVLGKYEDDNVYHQAVKSASSEEVFFVGPIYDKVIVQALRFHSAAYVHGHQVGGTNPSLVEALGAGNAVIAHDNRFNRWVAGEGAVYFDGADAFAKHMDNLLANPEILQDMGSLSKRRFEEAFRWNAVLSQYEALLTRFLPLH